MNKSCYEFDTVVMIGCVDGEFHEGSLAELPLYDKRGEIQRGKLVEFPKYSSL